MKVKGLFLSMCAIAALASCSQNDDVTAPAGSDAPEAQVTLKLEGDGVNSRVAGDLEEATEEGAKVKNVTVFFFNQTDFIVGAPQYVDDANTLETTPLKTTTDATQIVVIANLGEELATSSFQGVSSLSQLKKVDFSAIDNTAGVKVNQSATNLYSSGIGEISMGSGEAANIGTAIVQLHFISARINQVKFSWKDGQHYAANASEFNDDDNTWFYIKQVYMMKAQTNSPLLPFDATKNGTWSSGSFIPQTYAFAGGVSWGNAPWVWPGDESTTPVQTDDYLVNTMPTTSTTSIDNVLGDKAWYLFENPSASSYPTGLIVEIVWRSIENSTNPDELLSKYFTVYFGEKAGAAGTRPLLEAGKTYDMSISLTGSLEPGGNSSGGGDNPDTPSVDADITVTVNAAQWTTTAEIVKEFQ